MKKKEEGITMGTKTFTLQPNQKPTKKQLDMVQKAAAMPIIYDEDSPKLTEEQLTKFHRVLEKERIEREDNRKQNITLRLSPKAVKKAKSLGKGYTTILSKIIENALDNPKLAEIIIQESASLTLKNE